MEVIHSVKQSLKLIGVGLIFVLILSVIDYALKNPEITGMPRTLLNFGFFGSIVGCIYVPYGAYNLILSFGRKG